MTAHGHGFAGDRAFGDQAATYDRYRPGYPPALYDLIRETCGAGPGTTAFEIGPGTGQATIDLLRLGIDAIHLFEPDERLAAILRDRMLPWADDREITIDPRQFDDGDGDRASFDFGAAATVLHWLNQRTTLERAGALLRPGGWFASWWNVYGDPAAPDPFHEATRHILEPGTATVDPTLVQRMHFALDVAARTNDLRSSGLFEPAIHHLFRWDLEMDADAAAGLYLTFPNVNRRPPDERDRVLDGLRKVIEDEFGGRIRRPILMPVYLARRRG
ncbi:MAG TPA: class I SAM-dependent methyltransferase [Thermomicrobiales bacterium]|jgi:SAM-dependent methyltransferase|nr:class I SAM-dependent methyltransferase [Thermomicrobiales bacterium]